MPEKLIRESQVDALLAALVADQVSKTRAALNAVLPKGGGSPSAGVTQFVRQRPDGTWLNIVRDSNVGGRLYVATVDAAKAPGYGDGLQAGDIFVSTAGIKVAAFAPSVGSVTWTNISTSTGGTGGTTPTDPGGGTTPTTPGDTSAPSPTSRPYALLATTGQWVTTGGTNLVQALSDQAVSAAKATPTAGAGSGVGVQLDMSNFLHQPGNDLNVTLWGAAAVTAGAVTVSIGYQGQTYAAPIVKQVGATATALSFIWPADTQLVLPASMWRDVEVTISKTPGDLALVDVTLQSQPPTSTPSPGTDPLSPATMLWAPASVWYSDCSSAPAAKASAALVSYVRGQVGSGAVRLDCYADAAPIRMVSGSTPRVNITPGTSTRGAATLMHTSDGKGAMDAVPIPSDMPAPAGTFKTAVIGCVETKQVWEFLNLTKSGTAWTAEWGGRIDGVPTSGGAFPTGTGYTGSGLAWAAAAVKVDEAKDAAAGNVKAIPHAVGLNLNYDSAASTFCWPATRSDGTASETSAPRMGQRLRLKAGADLSACTAVGKAIGEAMKRYGAVVMGGAEKVSFLAESGATEQAKTGVDPWGAILAGKSVDTVLAGLPLDQLEAVSPGWGDPNWKVETDTGTTPTNPTNPTTPTDPGTNRRAIYINPGAKWLSGASCRAIEKGSEGMGSTYAQWRGEPCYMARCWADQGGKLDHFGSQNDEEISSLSVMYSNWHASMDVGIGYIGRASGESMSGAASGACDARWAATLQSYRKWWASRKDPSKVNAFISPAHEMNGNWYPWSVNSGNVAQFIAGWKRFRALQLKHFPESLLCFNVNRDTSGAGMDWRKMVPGWTEGGAAAIKQWVDVGGVDYYNMDPNSKSAAEWAQHILENDQWGAPKGLERHRAFWGAAGLPIQIPEWSNNASQGDSPAYAVGMNDFMRQWAGTGPGQVCADALFNLTEKYPDGRYAVVGDTVGSPNFAQKYRDLTWGY